MIYIFLDIILANYTIYPSFFFLTNLNKRNYLYNLAISFFIDFIITKTYFFNIIIVSILYFLRSKFIKYNNSNYFQYLNLNLLTTIIYYLLTTLIFSSFSLKKFLIIIVLHFLFYNICYIKGRKII